MSFISANDPTSIKPPETSLLRREDIIEGFGDLVSVYKDQQRRSLDGQVVVGDYFDRGASSSAPLLSTADELAERRKTSVFYIFAQVIVIALGMAGAVMVVAPEDARLPFWLLATGLGAATVIAYQHHREQNLSPEALQAQRDRHDFWIAESDLESRKILIEAQADVYRTYANADLEARQAQRQALDLEAKRIDASMKRRDEDRRRRWEDIAGAGAPATVLETVEPTVETVGETVFSTETTVETVGETVESVDPTLTLVLKTVVGFYDQVNPQNPLIKSAIPWSARSTAMSPDAKAKVNDVLSRLDPPLIELRNGRYYLNVGAYGPRRAARVLTVAWE